MKPTYLLTIFTLLCSLVVTQVHAQSAEKLIETARAQLGSEKALNDVRTLRFSGTVKIYIRDDKENPDTVTKTVEGKTELILEKTSAGTFKQRQEFNTDEIEEITALNGYEGWRFVRNKSDNEWRVMNFPADLLLRFQVTTAESIGFFKGYQDLYGKVEDLGNEKWEGREVRVLRFKYTGQVYFDRLFNPLNGALLATRDSNGVEIVEEGSVVVAGIRFPKDVRYQRAGKVLREESYQTIEVNASSKPDYYKFPSKLISSGELPTSRL